MDLNPKNLVPGFNNGQEESELWLRLQKLMAAGKQLDDHDVQALDERMQGFLFLQNHVENRRARIDFARNPSNMAYLRDAAGGNKVWMVDDEFSELVQEDNAVTLACFGRSEAMQLHHLEFIAFRLSTGPHRQDVLADAHEVQITIKKAIDKKGATQAWRLMKQAISQTGQQGPLAVWSEYVGLAMSEGLLAESNTGPFETSGRGAATVH